MTSGKVSIDPKVVDDAADVTLVIQASSDRIWMLTHICGRWHGPMVIVVYVKWEDQLIQNGDRQLRQRQNDRKLGSHSVAYWKAKRMNETAERNDYRTVTPSCPRARFIPYMQQSPEEAYPINQLRYSPFPPPRPSTFRPLPCALRPHASIPSPPPTSAQQYWHQRNRHLAFFID